MTYCEYFKFSILMIQNDVTVARRNTTEQILYVVLIVNVISWLVLLLYTSLKVPFIY